MTVRNEDKKPFRDLTPEERGEIVEAWLSGQVQGYIPNTGEWEDCGPVDFIYTLQAYRTKPRQLVIPWEVIKPEYKWAAMDGDGEVYLYGEKPKHESDQWCISDGKAIMANSVINIDTAGIDWRESLTERPEGV